MQTIVTKYLGPTETRGARIKATCDAGSIIINYKYELSGSDVHAQAAAALCRKLRWTGELICRSGDHIRGGYVFVFVSPVDALYGCLPDSTSVGPFLTEAEACD